ncbi:hypothetical protein MAR_20 [Vibrio phage vB_VpaM_MAR]|uniref:Uncharacterized protein n=1 Tax=Vibrio phage vB_VpaM_MAR TaxID=1229754 RepID=K7R2Q5_9CAUD|nr:hypothetical protein F861_gp22 [Vibrio phage vB_VpaM_MAR]AFV81359.1 hypothetical protein MAR_20 [Vibrio phage vB_VpaM_MAR]
MSLTQDVANVVQAANNLTSEVTNKMAQIDQRVDDAEGEYQGLIAGIRSDFPFYRVSKNQELKVAGVLTPGTAGTPDGYVNRNAAYHTCEIVAWTQSGVLPANKDPEIQAMFNDIKGGVPQHNYPDFAILRVSTSIDAVGTNGQFYTIYQGPIPNGIPYSIGCFIKAEIGDVEFGRPGSGYGVPADGKWHERILRFDQTSGGTSYDFGPHLYVAPGARALIALPALVAGKVPDGKWGFFQKPAFEHEG